MRGKVHVGGACNKIFMEMFRSMLHGFLPLLGASLTELCSFWSFIRLFHPAQSADIQCSCLLPLKLMASQTTEGTLIHMGG